MGNGTMATTHRSELVTKIADALTDEAYDGGMGPMSETEFSRYVRRLAETAVEAAAAFEHLGAAMASEEVTSDV